MPKTASNEAVLFFIPIDIRYTSCYDVLQERRYRMDIQMKRGLLDVCVLAAIENEDSYGYKIIKDLQPYISLSESTLYTILKRLESADMLTVRTAEHGGRLRKYYHITQAGLARIEDFKNEWKEILSIYRFVTKEDTGNDQD
jgi:PadR family transcriptional regulator PadR